DDHLGVDPPGALLAHERVELVLREPELVQEAILRRQHVRDVRDAPLDLPWVDGELEDLHLRDVHAGTLLLDPDLLGFPASHGGGDQAISSREPALLERLEVLADRVLGRARLRVDRHGTPHGERASDRQRPRTHVVSVAHAGATAEASDGYSPN